MTASKITSKTAFRDVMTLTNFRRDHVIAFGVILLFFMLISAIIISIFSGYGSLITYILGLVYLIATLLGYKKFLDNANASYYNVGPQFQIGLVLAYTLEFFILFFVFGTFFNFFYLLFLLVRAFGYAALLDTKTDLPDYVLKSMK